MSYYVNLTAEKKMEIRINLVGSGPKKGQYQLIYYNQYKKRTRIFKKTLEEAQAEKQRLESQQSRVFVETEEYTFGDLFNHYESSVKKDRRNVLRAINTILDIPAVSLNKRSLYKPLRDVLVKDLKASHLITQIFPSLTHNRTSKTARSYFRYFSIMLDRAVTIECRESNPCRNIHVSQDIIGQKESKPKITGDHIHPENIQKIIDAASPQWSLALMFASRMGMRQGEQRALQWGDINFEEGLCTVNKTIALKDITQGTVEYVKPEPKTEAGNRTLDIDPVLLLAIKKYKLSCDPLTTLDDCYIWASTNDNASNPWCSHSKMQREIEKAIQKADVPRITWKAMRNYFASLTRMNFDERYTTDQMGHSSIKITDSVYVKKIDTGADRTHFKEKKAEVFDVNNYRKKA